MGKQWQWDDSPGGRDWSRRLTRIILTNDGKILRTLAEAGTFVVEQDALRQHWFSAAQALMVASLEPNAVEDATVAVERALSQEGRLKSLGRA